MDDGKKKLSRNRQGKLRRRKRRGSGEGRRVCGDVRSWVRVLMGVDAAGGGGADDAINFHFWLWSRGRCGGNGVD